MILTKSYEPHFPPEWEGLDYSSADEATPKLFGVSFGNGNDGVSHMFADYYVKTCDPYALARMATLGYFKPKFQSAADEAMEIDGEADYTISSVIYNPEDVDPAEAPDPTYYLHFTCPECGETWELDESDELDAHDDCPHCDARDIAPDESSENEREETYSDFNAYGFICEVFREDDPREGRPMYDSLEECFGAESPEYKLSIDN